MYSILRNEARGGIMKDYIKMNIQRLMSQKGLNSVSLSEKSQISRQTISKILDMSSSNYNPNFSTIYTLAQTLGVTIPTLLSRVEISDMERKEILPKGEYIDILNGNFKKALQGKKQKAASVEPGLSESVISKLWNNINSNPNFSTIESISEITGIDIGKLFIRGEE